LNHLHVKLKSLNRTPTCTEQKSYQDTLTRLQEQVVQRKYHVAGKITAYEKHFFMKNNVASKRR
jgi:hypothetical protein